MSEVCEHVSRLFRQYTGTMHFLAVLKSGHVPPDHYHMIFLLSGSFMCIQLIYPFECLVTFRAGKWLISWVEPSMCLQITALLECIVTFGAGKWLLSCVDSFMCLQIPTLVECLITFGVGKWLLSCVDPFMFLQITTLVD